MLRDTFAVEKLRRPARLWKEVSLRLGHSSVKVTERHYLPWVHPISIFVGGHLLQVRAAFANTIPVAG
jgi:integrase